MRRAMLVCVGLLIWGCTQIPVAAVPLPSTTPGKVVVTDIDGTLTPKNLDVFEARPEAAAVLNTLAQQGYQIVYLTARTPLLQAGLPQWLHDHGFPPGPLHVAQSAEERHHPDQYKARVLEDYIHAGWQLAYAFGDSTTDFIAYAAAGIPRQDVFALRRRGSATCQPGVYQACLGSWPEFLGYFDTEVPATPRAMP